MADAPSTLDLIRKRCPNCRGRGRVGELYCAACGGTRERQKWMKCPKCDGKPMSDIYRCAGCGGTGAIDIEPTIAEQRALYLKRNRPQNERCTSCDGVGIIYVVVGRGGERQRVDCSRCGGSGARSDMKEKPVARDPNLKPLAPAWRKTVTEKAAIAASVAAAPVTPSMPKQIECPWCQGDRFDNVRKCEPCGGVGHFTLVNISQNANMAGQYSFHAVRVVEGGLPGSTEEEHPKQSPTVVTSVKPKFTPKPRFSTRKVDDK
jgi:DnaJ-class molecular chaperone